MDYYSELIEKCKETGKVEFIGRTVAGFDIPLVRTGMSPKTLIVASVHAREHITTDLVTELFFGREYAFDIVPCLNIDGVILARQGDGAFADRREFLRRINGGEDYSLWKANLNAVDLNVNFDAKWGEGKSNVLSPSPANYIGACPESEPETRAIVKLLEENPYAQVVCYHLKGEVIYWGFDGIRRHEKEAKEYAASVGYRLMTAEYSAGGLKDRYDLSYKGLGLTVEVGKDEYRHPYPKDKLPELIEQHKRSVEILYENGERIARKIYGGGIA